MAKRKDSTSGGRAKSRAAGLTAGQIRFHSRSRSRSHERAEAEVNGDELHIPDHPDIPAGEPAMIDRENDLADLLDHLRQAGSFAYDTEFIGELTYFPRMCVIQVATSSRVALIDAEADLDLQPFWELLADPAVELIVHAGAQDIEPIVRSTGRPAGQVFDTQVAAGFIALPYPLSLRELVRTAVGAVIGKGHTFSQWDRRPLSATQIRYAADDVRYLPAVRKWLAERLDSTGHADWARQECARLIDPGNYSFDPAAAAMRFKGARSLRPAQLGRLMALLAAREAIARSLDVPARTLMRDEAMRNLARKSVGSAADLQRASGLPQAVVRAHGDALLAALTNPLQPPADYHVGNGNGQESALDRQRFDSLWAALQCYCFGQGVHPSLVASRQDLTRFLVTTTKAQRKRLPLAQGWRAELTGPFFDAAEQREGELRLRWTDEGLSGQIESQ